MTDPAAGSTSRGVHRLSEPAAGRPGMLGAGRWRGLLGRPTVISHGTGGRAEVALTFDDGPSPWTAEIAAVLEAHGCRGTFFVRGPAIEERPRDVAALVRAGHEIGSHLWSHTNAAAQSRAEIRAEIKRTANAIRVATGQRARLVRPPYCRAPEAVADAARGVGVRLIVQRSVGSGDWAATVPEDVSQPLMETAVAGDIIGLHDGISPDERDSDSREVTIDAMVRLVPGLLERGLKPVTVSRLLA